MATTRETFPAIKGPIAGQYLAQEHLGSGNKMGAFLATYDVGALFNKNAFPIIGGNSPYVAAQWTVTSSGTGAAQAQATTPGGGLLLTTGSSSTFYSGLQSKETVTPTVGKRYCAYMRWRVGHATQVGFNFGFANAQADPTGTEYTDFVGFRKAPTSASVLGTVCGNGAAAVQTAALITTVLDTEYIVGFWFDLEATAATCAGSWFYGTDPDALTELPMSSTILAEVVKLLTTPVTDWGLTVFATGTSGNNATFTPISVIAHGDR